MSLKIILPLAVIVPAVAVYIWQQQIIKNIKSDNYQQVRVTKEESYYKGCYSQTLSRYPDYQSVNENSNEIKAANDSCLSASKSYAW